MTSRRFRRIDEDLYIREMRRESMVTPDEEVELGRRIRGGDVAARDRLIRANLRLAFLIAKSWPLCGLDLADVVQWANLGLVHAVDRFDPDRGTKFGTFASWWIKHAIRRGAYDQVTLIRVPAHVKQLKVAYARALVAAGGDREAARDRVGAERFHMLDPGLAAATPIELTPLCRVDRDFVRAVDPESEAIEADELEWLESRIALLDGREAEVVRRCFGIDGLGEETFKDLAVRYGVTRERIYQLKRRALAKLRKAMGVVA